jgi:ACS family pantothenate transporter-like MFS transporter
MFGYFFFPDTPHTTSAFYLTEEEKQLARERMPIMVESESILSIAFVKQVLSSWYFYGFCMLWILGNCSESQSSQSLMNLFMQALPDKNYSVSQLNNYPTGVQAVGIVSTLVWALGTDIWGGRWASGYYVSVTAIGNAVILITPSSTVAAKFGAYYWAGTIYCIQATFFAWANDSMRSSSPTLRACIIACMNSAGNCFQAWWPLIFYRADDAPNFTVSTPYPWSEFRKSVC